MKKTSCLSGCPTAMMAGSGSVAVTAPHSWRNPGNNWITNLRLLKLQTIILISIF